MIELSQPVSTPAINPRAANNKPSTLNLFLTTDHDYVQ